MKDALVCLVVDASGSMGLTPDGRVPNRGEETRRDQTMKGLNSFLTDQRGNPAKTYVSVTVFNTAAEAPFVGREIQEMPEFGAVELPYGTGGGTALYDAIGVTIKGAEKWLENHPDFDGQVAVVIGTDGEENSSVIWHAYQPPDEKDDQDINNLIRYKQGEKWEFVFLGAGPDAWTNSQRLSAMSSVAGGSSLYDARHTADSYSGVSQSFTASRSTGTALLANVSSNKIMRSISNNVNEWDQTQADQTSGGGGSGG